ncbi:MAG: lectin like domain-containing protein [Armatimonadota bacterium]
MANSGWSSRVSVWLVSLVLLCASWAPAGAQAMLEAPVNPDFQREETRSPGGTYGYRPSPVDWSHLRSGHLSTRAILPATYDLRAQGRVTAVRNQNPAGTCWAFGALASLESCLQPGETADFSENHMKNTSGFDLHPNNGGGNRDMVTAYLARWSGPVYESDDPYNPSTTTSPAGLVARKHLQNVIYLPDRTGPTDNNAIKQAVMTYGAVMTLYYANSNYFKPETHGYYNPDTTSVNHAVAIVGWNDNFSAANFINTPPGNGAFIVKNSWGSAWGEGGYFYMSYYEPTLRQNTVYYEVEAVSNYSRCYQYDPLGMVSSTGYGNNTGWLANIFTAAGSDLISAVGTFAQKPDSTYQLSVYLDPTNGPIGGTPVATQSGTFTDAGYHTVSLNSPVMVMPGQRFSVVMRITTPGYNYPIPVEKPFTGYSSAASATSGQSFISSSGNSWTDLTQSAANANVCLKAFAQPGSASGPALTAVSLAATPASPQAAGASVTLAATPTGGASVLYKFEANLNGMWTTLREYASGNTAAWTPGMPGLYSLKVSAYDAGDPDTVVTKTLSYTVLEPLSAVALDASLSSPQGLGQTIRLSATKTGGASVQYRFIVSSNGGASWTVLQDYNTAADYDWTLAAVGEYLCKVFAREGATGVPVGSETMPFTIASVPTAVALAASPASPEPAGAEITLTAAKTGGAATVQYRFEVSANGGASWALLQNFSTAASVAWAPQDAGSYLLKVTAREPAMPDVTVTDTLAYSIVEPLSAVALAASLPAPQPVNKAVRLTATKTGGASVQYQYAASTDGGATWTVVQAYTATAYEDWTPAVPGSYMLKVAAREGAAGMPVESAPIAFTVAPAPPTAVALAASPVSPQFENTAVTLTAAKTGGTASVQYQFEVSANGGAGWTILQAFGSAAVETWTPQAAGAYLLKVTAREPMLPALAVSGTLAFTVVQPLSAVELTASPASPQPVKQTIRLNAERTGGVNVQYQFYVSTDNGVTWSILQKWTTASYKDWKPSAIRDYLLKVEAREGAAGVPVTSSACSYTITPAPPTAVKLTVGPASPRTVRTPITLKASKKGGKYVEYKFEASTNGGASWITLRDYNALATAGWTPAAAAGYTLRVSARESMLPGVVVTATVPFTIAEALTSVALSSAQARLQTKSTRIQLSATPAGGANVQYLYSVSKNNGLTWSTLRKWNNVAAYNWSPSATGEYLVKVSAREDKTGTPFNSSTLAFTIAPKPPTAVSLSASVRSPQLINTPVKLSAKKKGGSLVQYQFEASENNGATWMVLQGYGSAGVCYWQPASPASYLVRVTARETAYPIAPVTGSLAYVIAPPLSAVALNPVQASPRAVNQPIPLTAEANGGASVKYQFSLSSNDGATWSVLQKWSDQPTKIWKPTRVGTYQLKVAAREGSNGVPVESAAVQYKINVLSQEPAPVWNVNLIARTGVETARISIGESEVTPAVVVADEPGSAMAVYLEQLGQPALAAEYRMRSVGRQQWQFVVKRNPEAADFTDIVLTWPEIGKAPREISFTLVDLTTGARRYMRTSAYYVIPASRGAGDHRFQIIASREPSVPLQIVGLAPESTRAAGTRVSYTLTRPAQVMLTVRALSGRVVYRLAMPEAQAAGLNTLMWDGRGTGGINLPGGAYQFELVASDAEEYRIRALTLVTLR